MSCPLMVRDSVEVVLRLRRFAWFSFLELGLALLKLVIVGDRLATFGLFNIARQSAFVC